MGHSPELDTESRPGVVLRDLNIRHGDAGPTDTFHCVLNLFLVWFPVKDC